MDGVDFGRFRNIQKCDMQQKRKNHSLRVGEVLLEKY